MSKTNGPETATAAKRTRAKREYIVQRAIPVMDQHPEQRGSSGWEDAATSNKDADDAIKQLKGSEVPDGEYRSITITRHFTLARKTTTRIVIT